MILPADTLRIYISGNNGCQIKKPEFNNFKNMKNPDKKIPVRNRNGIEIIQPFTLNEELIKNSVEKAAGSMWRLDTVIEPSYKVQVGSEALIRVAFDTLGQKQRVLEPYSLSLSSIVAADISQNLCLKILSLWHSV